MSAPEWPMFQLQDSTGKDASDALAFPIHSPPAPSSSNVVNPPVPKRITNLCALPPADLSHRIPPQLIDPSNYSGCSMLLNSSCGNSPNFGIPAKFKCLFDTFFAQRYGVLDVESSHYCIPLDTPVLADRGIIPVPSTTNHTQLQSAHWRNGPFVPVLKDLYESRNHSAASLPPFANATVRAGHKRLRLGVCSPFPPIRSPCSLAAIDNKTGTLAKDWLVDGEFFGFSMAYPAASFSSLSGPDLNVMDHLTFSATNLPPHPFFTLLPQSQYSVRDMEPKAAWAVPIIRCIPNNASSTTGLGSVQALVIQGACSSNRDCLSGVCDLVNKACDNSIKPGTQTPFSPSFMIQFSPSQPVTYPTERAARNYIFSFQNVEPELLPEMAQHFQPLIIAFVAVFGIGTVLLVWGCVRARVHKLSHGWWTTTDREIELTPVSGAMVADMGDERAAQDQVEGAQEQLPTYSMR